MLRVIIDVALNCVMDEKGIPKNYNIGRIEHVIFECSVLI